MGSLGLAFDPFDDRQTEVSRQLNFTGRNGLITAGLQLLHNCCKRA